MDKKLNAVYMVETITPQDADRKVLMGCISEGIRIYVRSAPNKKPWKDRTIAKWSRESVSNVLQKHSGLEVTRRGRPIIDGRRAELFSLVGGTAGMYEHEKRSFVFIGNSKHLVAIELVAPYSKKDDYDIILAILLGTFSLLE